MKVLVVDDAAVIRNISQTVCESFGCSVTTAINGAEAMLELCMDSFDLILLDIEMPLMNGWEVYHELQADECTSDIWFMSIHEQEKHHPLMVEDARILPKDGQFHRRLVSLLSELNVFEQLAIA